MFQLTQCWNSAPQISGILTHQNNKNDVPMKHSGIDSFIALFTEMFAMKVWGTILLKIYKSTPVSVSPWSMPHLTREREEERCGLVWTAHEAHGIARTSCKGQGDILHNPVQWWQLCWTAQDTLETWCRNTSASIHSTYFGKAFMADKEKQASPKGNETVGRQLEDLLFTLLCQLDF